jgi:hypothetical protein
MPHYARSVGVQSTTPMSWRSQSPALGQRSRCRLDLEPSRPDLALASHGTVSSLFMAGFALPALTAPRCADLRWRGRLSTVQNRVEVHRKRTGNLVPFSPKRVPKVCQSKDRKQTDKVLYLV